MPWKRGQILISTVTSVALLSAAGCNRVLGFDKLSIGDLPPGEPECTNNRECTNAASMAAMTEVGATADASAPSVIPAICVKPEGRCVRLYSEDCATVVGDYSNDDAIIIGSLFAVKGPTATQNIPRQQSAQLAVEEINAVGGIPTSIAGVARPLVMLSCDTSANLTRAATHLVGDVRAPAIVGPNTSQDTLDVSNDVTIKAGTVVMSPTAVAASIADLIDNDLTWLMIPSDDQRGSLMIQQINALESLLKLQRSVANIKLAIIYRDDALGVGTRTSLNALTLNAKRLADPINAGSAGGFVQIEPYHPTQTDLGAIVAREIGFAPDIVVLAGTAETVTKIMTPLEQQWSAGDNRPYYLFIDPSKGPELLNAVTGNDNLRLRVRGTGTTPGPDSVSVNNSFSLSYIGRYGASPTASGTGPSYDAAYSLAYALAATKDLPVTGANIAVGLRRLAGGNVGIATGRQYLLQAFQTLASGQDITGIGTFCPLDWNPNGSVKGGTIEIWCIGQSGTSPVFQSSGLTFDIVTQTFSGTYVQCS